MNIEIIKTQTPKQKPDQKNLGFGDYFTDHMFTMRYTKGQGWHSPKIEPYAPIQMDPAAMVLHYAQEIFEGLKAYRSPEGKILLFRPERMPSQTPFPSGGEDRRNHRLLHGGGSFYRQWKHHLPSDGLF